MVRERVRVDGNPVLWETCQTFSGSWGYHRDDLDWKERGAARANAHRYTK